MRNNFIIPADVPASMHTEFQNNYDAITHGTGRLMLFACDQKIEHLNASFYGKNIAADDNNPTHIFNIAQQGKIGALATQLGLIARYAHNYSGINYIAKLNSKTNLVKTAQHDPMSALLWSVEQVVALKEQSQLPIRGVGYTLYLGSEYESAMLAQAAQVIYTAHQHGLVTVLWVYPRGKAVTDERTAEIIAGAAGVANALGADFVKVNPPDAQPDKTSAQLLNIATQAAGNTKVICSGGAAQDPQQFLRELYDQLHIGNTAGNATGRNIHQRTLKDAVAMCNAIAALVIENKSLEEAYAQLGQ